MTYHGRWTYKFEEAAKQGAAGAIVHGPPHDPQRRQPDDKRGRVTIQHKAA
jgi:hypothetical protein